MPVDARPLARHAAERPGERVERVLLELRDRVRVFDPGAIRLRTALSAAVCVGTALPVQLGLGALLGYQGQVGFAATMFGAVVAMMGSNALIGYDLRTKVRTAVFFPVAVAAGLLPATLASGRQIFQVVGFAAVLFGAVWVRRWGPAWFNYGFLAWIGFFFATFLHTTWSLVPELLVASVVSTLWVLLLSSTVFRTNPSAALHATAAAFFAAGRAVARECADLLEVPPGADVRRRRALRSLSARESALSDSSLLAEAWSSVHGAMPEGWSPSALRRRLIETQQAVERFSIATVDLHDAPPDVAVAARRVVDHVAHRRDRAADWAATRLLRLVDQLDEDQQGSRWAAQHLAFGVREFLRFDAAADEPPEADPGEAEFEAATGLIAGNLPGSPAAARDVAARGSRWNPVARASMSTRQAVQVALAGVLALLAGALMSPTRYYWAVITVFITFTGTGSRSETFAKGVARTAGTLLGIVAAILLAHVTAGHTVAIFAVILLSIFFTFYLMRVSNAGMAFFITLLLGQLYVVIGTFTDSLLALRLGETAIGAGIGVVVALLFAPLSTRDTIRSVRAEVYTAMGELLEGAAAYSSGGYADLDGLTRRLDDAARRLVLVARPMTRSFAVGGPTRRIRRRVALIVAAVSQCRAITVSLRQHAVRDAPEIASACRSLAEAVEALAGVAMGEPAPEAGIPVRAGDQALFAGRDHDDDPVVRHLHHLGATLFQLAETDPVLVAARAESVPA